MPATTAPTTLTGSDRKVLAALRVTAWFTNNALRARYGWTLVGAQRRKLNDAGLVTSRRVGRMFEHLLTDAAAPTTEPTEDRIRAAYQTLAPASGGWISIRRIREQLAHVDRATLDDTLRRMERHDLFIAPEANQKTLTQADRDAAIVIGGKPKHLIWIQD